MNDLKKEALVVEIFDKFVGANTMKQCLQYFRDLCTLIKLHPSNIKEFYPILKNKLAKSWRAQAIFKKLDLRYNLKVYGSGNCCLNTRVLVIGGGPCGLRSAIDAQLLGAKVVIIEKRDRMSRNNVLHLWPFVIEDLRHLGAKKFFGKFGAGSIDHISIRQLQLILLKVALILGIQITEGVCFERLIEPDYNGQCGWRASVSPENHPLKNYEFDVLIGADGKRNTLPGFKRKEFRGKLAIAITANFINRHTKEESIVPEISGISYIYKQEFFKSLYKKYKIDLENIVYYKDSTHYFVMTAKKQSLLDRGVLKQDHAETLKLLSPDNVDNSNLCSYVMDAVEYSTEGQLTNMEFAVNHYGQPDVAVFDFTSMYAAENASQVLEKHNRKLLTCLVGDSLLEPFWPTGSGCARGFLSSLDACWAIRQWGMRHPALQVIAERESIYRLLAQTTPKNLNADISNYTVDPTTRYVALNKNLVSTAQVLHLYKNDIEEKEKLKNINYIGEEPTKETKDKIVEKGVLMRFFEISDISDSLRNGHILFKIIDKYRPFILDRQGNEEESNLENALLAIDIFDMLGIPRTIDSVELLNASDDEIQIYLSHIYNFFKGEIPIIPHSLDSSQYMDSANVLDYQSFERFDAKKLAERRGNRLKNTLKRKSGSQKDTSQIFSSASTLDDSFFDSQLDSKKNKIKRRNIKRSIGTTSRRDLSLLKVPTVDNLRRLFDIVKKSSQLVENDEQKKTFKLCQKILDAQKMFLKSESMLSNDFDNETKSQPIDTGGTFDITSKIKHLEQILNTRTDKPTEQIDIRQINKKPADLMRAIGTIDANDWQIQRLEKEITSTKPGTSKDSKEKVPKWDKSQFIERKRKIVTPSNEEDKRFSKLDDSLKKLDYQLKHGNTLNIGERGKNKVSQLASQFVVKDNISESKEQAKSAVKPISVHPQKEACHVCDDHVYLMEKVSPEDGLVLHKKCFKCSYCSVPLNLRNYMFDRDGHYNFKIFCIHHYGMERGNGVFEQLESHAPKPLDVIDSIPAEGDNHRDNTPERVEVIIGNEKLDESLPIDEDEWHNQNFGSIDETSYDENSSEDDDMSSSELASSDSEDFDDNDGDDDEDDEEEVDELYAPETSYKDSSGEDVEEKDEALSGAWGPALEERRREVALKEVPASPTPTDTEVDNIPNSNNLFNEKLNITNSLISSNNISENLEDNNLNDVDLLFDNIVAEALGSDNSKRIKINLSHENKDLGLINPSNSACLDNFILDNYCNSGFYNESLNNSEYFNLKSNKQVIALDESAVYEPNSVGVPADMCNNLQSNIKTKNVLSESNDKIEFMVKNDALYQNSVQNTQMIEKILNGKNQELPAEYNYNDFLYAVDKFINELLLEAEFYIFNRNIESGKSSVNADNIFKQQESPKELIYENDSGAGETDESFGVNVDCMDNMENLEPNGENLSGESPKEINHVTESVEEDEYEEDSTEDSVELSYQNLNGLQKPTNENMNEAKSNEEEADESVDESTEDSVEYNSKDANRLKQSSEENINTSKSIEEEMDESIDESTEDSVESNSNQGNGLQQSPEEEEETDESLDESIEDSVELNSNDDNGLQKSTHENINERKTIEEETDESSDESTENSIELSSNVISGQQKATYENINEAKSVGEETDESVDESTEDSVELNSNDTNLLQQSSEENINAAKSFEVKTNESIDERTKDSAELNSNNANGLQSSPEDNSNVSKSIEEESDESSDESIEVSVELNSNDLNGLQKSTDENIDMAKSIEDLLDQSVDESTEDSVELNSNNNYEMQKLTDENINIAKHIEEESDESVDESIDDSVELSSKDINKKSTDEYTNVAKSVQEETDKSLDESTENSVEINSNDDNGLQKSTHENINERKTIEEETDESVDESMEDSMELSSSDLNGLQKSTDGNINEAKFIEDLLDQSVDESRDDSVELNSNNNYELQKLTDENIHTAKSIEGETDESLEESNEDSVELNNKDTNGEAHSSEENIKTAKSVEEETDKSVDKSIEDSVEFINKDTNGQQQSSEESIDVSKSIEESTGESLANSSEDDESNNNKIENKKTKCIIVVPESCLKTSIAQSIKKKPDESEGIRIENNLDCMDDIINLFENQQSGLSSEDINLTREAPNNTILMAESTVEDIDESADNSIVGIVDGSMEISSQKACEEESVEEKFTVNVDCMDESEKFGINPQENKENIFNEDSFGTKCNVRFDELDIKGDKLELYIDQFAEDEITKISNVEYEVEHFDNGLFTGSTNKDELKYSANNIVESIIIMAEYCMNNPMFLKIILKGTENSFNCTVKEMIDNLHDNIISSVENQLIEKNFIFFSHSANKSLKDPELVLNCANNLVKDIVSKAENLVNDGECTDITTNGSGVIDQFLTHDVGADGKFVNHTNYGDTDFVDNYDEMNIGKPNAEQNQKPQEIMFESLETSKNLLDNDSNFQLISHFDEISDDMEVDEKLFDDLFNDIIATEFNENDLASDVIGKKENCIYSPKKSDNSYSINNADKPYLADATLENVEHAENLNKIIDSEKAIVNNVRCGISDSVDNNIISPKTEVKELKNILLKEDQNTDSSTAKEVDVKNIELKDEQNALECCITEDEKYDKLLESLFDAYTSENTDISLNIGYILNSLESEELKENKTDKKKKKKSKTSKTLSRPAENKDFNLEHENTAGNQNIEPRKIQIGNSVSSTKEEIQINNIVLKDDQNTDSSTNEQVDDKSIEPKDDQNTVESCITEDEKYAKLMDNLYDAYFSENTDISLDFGYILKCQASEEFQENKTEKKKKKKKIQDPSKTLFKSAEKNDFNLEHENLSENKNKEPQKIQIETFISSTKEEVEGNNIVLKDDQNTDSPTNEQVEVNSIELKDDQNTDSSTNEQEVNRIEPKDVQNTDSSTNEQVEVNSIEPKDDENTVESCVTEDEKYAKLMDNLYDAYFSENTDISLDFGYILKCLASEEFKENKTEKKKKKKIQDPSKTKPAEKKVFNLEHEHLSGNKKIENCVLEDCNKNNLKASQDCLIIQGNYHLDNNTTEMVLVGNDKSISETLLTEMAIFDSGDKTQSETKLHDSNKVKQNIKDMTLQNDEVTLVSNKSCNNSLNRNSHAENNGVNTVDEHKRRDNCQDLQELEEVDISFLNEILDPLTENEFNDEMFDKLFNDSVIESDLMHDTKSKALATDHLIESNVSQQRIENFLKPARTPTLSESSDSDNLSFYSALSDNDLSMSSCESDINLCEFQTVIEDSIATKPQTISISSFLDHISQQQKLLLDSSKSSTSSASVYTNSNTVHTNNDVSQNSEIESNKNEFNKVVDHIVEAKTETVSNIDTYKQNNDESSKSDELSYEYLISKGEKISLETLDKIYNKMAYNNNRKNIQSQIATSRVTAKGSSDVENKMKYFSPSLEKISNCLEKISPSKVLGKLGNRKQNTPTSPDQAVSKTSEVKKAPLVNKPKIFKTKGSKPKSKCPDEETEKASTSKSSKVSGTKSMMAKPKTNEGLLSSVYGMSSTISRLDLPTKYFPDLKNQGEPRKTFFKKSKNNQDSNENKN